MKTVNFTGTQEQLQKAKKTFLKGVKVKHKEVSCFYCNCLENSKCGCSCHRPNKSLSKIGWGNNEN